MEEKAPTVSAQLELDGGAVQPTPYAPAAAHVAPQKSAKLDALVKPLGGAHVNPDEANAAVKLPAVYMVQAFATVTWPEVARTATKAEHSVPAPRAAIAEKAPGASAQATVPGGVEGGEGGVQPLP